MPGPFPGMDPFLESPAYWRDFHQSFITYWRDWLLDHLPDHYEVRIDERLCVEPEAYLKVLHRPDASLIAVLELLSPTNKSGEGRRDYLIKRQDLFQEPVHMVELDLLLGGIRLPMKQKLPAGNYYAFVSRGDRRPNCEVYHWRLRDPLPRIGLPLKAPDPDVVFDFWQRSCNSPLRPKAKTELPSTIGLQRGVGINANILDPFHRAQAKSGILDFSGTFHLTIGVRHRE